MDLDIINRLYLELSQVATATTAKELKLAAELKRAQDIVASYDRQDELLGTEFEGVDEVTEVIRLLKQQRDETPSIKKELMAHIATLNVTSENIGAIRARLLMPFDCSWNGWVRDLTAEREGGGGGSEIRRSR